ncbi:hypothetical protein ACTXJ9_10980 [Brachybacterium tyrofermentans]|uniref:hypothetical protein n=1 Tax=Brachybacterium tyrofermentans TaxID=47848 RepID=UPI003FD245CE
MNDETGSLVTDIVRWDDTIATDGPCDGTWDSLAEYLTGLGWTRHPSAHDARVRRDAAREALDGLIQDLREKGRCAADSSLPDVTDLAEIVWHAQDEARTYRDTHYPEETP